MIDKRVFRREHHVIYAKKRIWTRREDFDAGAAVSFASPARTRGTGVSDPGYRKFDLGAVAPSDPIPLQQLDRLRPIESLQLVDQSVGVGGNAQHPLPHRP